MSTYRGTQRDQRQQDHNNEHDGRSRGNHRVSQRLHELVVSAGELACLADKGAAVAVVVESHGLVCQHVKTHGRQVVVDQDLQLPQTVVLEFAADLSQDIAHDQRKNVRTENRKDLVGRDMRSIDPVYDSCDNERIAKGQKIGVTCRGEKIEQKIGPMSEGRSAKIVEGASGDGRFFIIVVRRKHILSFGAA